MGVFKFRPMHSRTTSRKKWKHSIFAPSLLSSIAAMGVLGAFSACTKTAFKSQNATPVPSASSAPAGQKSPNELDGNGTNKPRTSPNETDANGRAKDAAVPVGANGEPLPGTTTTAPNGTTTTTYPEGTTVTKAPDGTTTIKNPDGTITTVTPNGTKTTTTPNGTTSTTTPNGTTTTTKPNGSTVVTGPNGEKLPGSVASPNTGQTTPPQTGGTVPGNTTTPPVPFPSSGCAQGSVTPVDGISSGAGQPTSYVDYSTNNKADLQIGYASVKSAACDIYIVGRNGAAIVNSSQAGSVNVVGLSQIFWASPYGGSALRQINTNVAGWGYSCVNNGSQVTVYGPQNRVIGQTGFVPAIGTKAPVNLAPNTCLGRQQDLARNPKDFWFVTSF